MGVICDSGGSYMCRLCRSMELVEWSLVLGPVTRCWKVPSRVLRLNRSLRYSVGAEDIILQAMMSDLLVSAGERYLCAPRGVSRGARCAGGYDAAHVVARAATKQCCCQRAGACQEAGTTSRLEWTSFRNDAVPVRTIGGCQGCSFEGAKRTMICAVVVGCRFSFCREKADVEIKDAHSSAARPFGW